MRKINIISSVLLPLLCANSFAENKTTAIISQVTLSPTCTISMPNINFGVISYKNDSLVFSTLTFKCSKSVSGVIAFINESTDNLNYNYLLHSDDRSEKLFYQFSEAGKGYITDNDVMRDKNVVGTGEEQSRHMAFVLFRNQYVKPGNYSGNLTVKIDY